MATTTSIDACELPNRIERGATLIDVMQRHPVIQPAGALFKTPGLRDPEVQLRQNRMNVKHMLLCATALGAFTALTACARAPEMSGTNAAVTAPPVTRATTADALTATPPPTVSPVVLRGDANTPRMVVHKSASCGCCGLWVDHMRSAGFAVDVRNSDDLNPLKERVGVPYGKGSCHTAEVGGYFIEGHVPAADIKRLLAEKPDAKGLVLPGMPMGSPGMESPDGTVQPYTVELVGRDGATTAFAEHVGTQ